MNGKIKSSKISRNSRYLNYIVFEYVLQEYFLTVGAKQQCTVYKRYLRRRHTDMQTAAERLHEIVPGSLFVFEHFFEFDDGFGFDLSDPFAGHAEFLAYFVKRE